MAKDLFVKRLKGVADNDDLSVYNVLKLEVASGNGVAEVIVSGIPVGSKITANGSIHFTNEQGSEDLGKEITTENDTTTFYMSAGSGNVFIENKYSISYFSCVSPKVSVNVREFAYNTGSYLTLGNGLVGTNHMSAYGDISDSAFKWTNMQFGSNGDITGSINKTIESFGEQLLELTLYNTNIDFNLALLQQCPNLIQPFSASNKTYGDISNFGFTKVTNVYIDTNVADVLTGSIESLVANKIASGSTSGEFTLPWCQTFTKVTFNNKTLQQNVAEGVIRSAGNTKFTWDAQGNITWS